MTFALYLAVVGVVVAAIPTEVWVAFIVSGPPTLAALLSARSANIAAKSVKPNGSGMTVTHLAESIKAEQTVFRREVLQWQAQHNLDHQQASIEIEIKGDGVAEVTGSE